MSRHEYFFKVETAPFGEIFPFKTEAANLGLDAYSDPVTACEVVPSDTKLTKRRMKLLQVRNDSRCKHSRK